MCKNTSVFYLGALNTKYFFLDAKIHMNFQNDNKNTITVNFSDVDCSLDQNFNIKTYLTNLSLVGS